MRCGGRGGGVRGGGSPEIDAAMLLLAPDRDAATRWWYAEVPGSELGAPSPGTPREGRRGREGEGVGEAAGVNGPHTAAAAGGYMLNGINAPGPVAP